MLNIDLTKVRPAESKRGEVIEWRTEVGTARPDDTQDRAGDAGGEAGHGRPDHDENDQRWFAMAVAPWLTPDARVAELGPGFGQWTVRIAPLVREVVVVDDVEMALERTRLRLQAAAITNVSFVLGSGRDLQPLPSDRFDLVFGYDAFVHIPFEDTVGYVGEIARVLRDDGLAVLHHIVQEGRTHHPHAREGLDRMYGRFGLRVESVWTDASTMVVTARRPADSVVPRLEQALRQAAAADDERALDDAMRAVTDVGRELNDRLAPLATALLATAPGPDRHEVIQRIRRLVRG
jgi:ubiquinone/menaquinone biosynthesis C-methylase UbiE